MDLCYFYYIYSVYLNVSGNSKARFCMAEEINNFLNFNFDTKK